MEELSRPERIDLGQEALVAKRRRLVEKRLKSEIS